MGAGPAAPGFACACAPTLRAALAYKRAMPRRLALAVVVLLASCGGGDDGAGSGAGPYGLEQRVPVGALAFPDAALQSGDVRVERAFPNLNFGDPLAVVEAPGDTSRRFVANHGGEIFVFDDSDGATGKRLFLDLTDVTKAYDEEGLVSLAFDPAYAQNGFFYVYYTANIGFPTPGDTVIARFHADPATAIADRGSEVRLLQFEQAPGTGHKAGHLVFGPDGMLYAVVGYGGDADDPDNNAQNLGSYLGKILRLTPAGGIPPDNPFVGRSGARGEIWAYGLRNPFRMAFDPETGLLWAADVGQYNWEEIDVITRGGNYGWRVLEGTHVYTAGDPVPADAIAPIYEYDHGQGCAVIGGAVYRGQRLPGHQGHYFYTDYCSGTLWALTQDNGAFVANAAVGQVPGNPTSFGTDAAGELYVTSFDGNVYRLVPGAAGEPAPFPQRLSQTGLFADTARLEPAPGLIEYEVNAPLWSDGARKRRWLALPGTRTIGFDADGAWSWPVATVLVKHFEMTLADGSDRRLETRVLVNHSDGWHGYTYRWNESGTDADLLPAGAFTTLTVADPAAPGGTRTQTYEFPGRGACLECHNDAARVLGLRTAQVNRDFDYGATVDNQLRSFDHVGLFSSRLGPGDGYARLADPADTGASLSSRARAYLDGNCAHCHQPAGFPNTAMDLRASTPIAQTATRDVPPQKGDLGLPDARVIAPGAKERSVLWERIRRLDGTRMPPLASHAVDEDAVALIGAWIDAGAN